jgi:hypothetical protein
MNWDLSQWLPLIDDRCFLDWLVKVRLWKARQPDASNAYVSTILVVLFLFVYIDIQGVGV